MKLTLFEYLLITLNDTRTIFLKFKNRDYYIEAERVYKVYGRDGLKSISNAHIKSIIDDKYCTYITLNTNIK